MILGIPGPGQFVILLIIVSFLFLIGKLITIILKTHISPILKVLYIATLFFLPVIGILLVYLLTKNLKVDVVPIGENK